VPATGSMAVGNGQTPANSTSVDRLGAGNGGAGGTGGDSGSNGSNGVVIIRYY
jgi:hypothetical protein